MDPYRIEAAPGSASVSLGRTGNSGEPCGDSQLPGVGVDAGTSLVGSPLRPSGCGTGLTSSCGTPPKSAGLHGLSVRDCATTSIVPVQSTGDMYKSARTSASVVHMSPTSAANR